MAVEHPPACFSLGGDTRYRTGVLCCTIHALGPWQPGSRTNQIVGDFTYWPLLHRYRQYCTALAEPITKIGCGRLADCCLRIVCPPSHTW